MPTARSGRASPSTPRRAHASATSTTTTSTGGSTSTSAPPADNIVREFNDPPVFGRSKWHTTAYEVMRLRDPAHKRCWRVEHQPTGAAYDIVPGVERPHRRRRRLRHRRRLASALASRRDRRPAGAGHAHPHRQVQQPRADGGAGRRRLVRRPLHPRRHGPRGQPHRRARPHAPQLVAGCSARRSTGAPSRRGSAPPA